MSGLMNIRKQMRQMASVRGQRWMVMNLVRSRSVMSQKGIKGKDHLSLFIYCTVMSTSMKKIVILLFLTSNLCTWTKIAVRFHLILKAELMLLSQLLRYLHLLIETILISSPSMDWFNLILVSLHTVWTSANNDVSISVKPNFYRNP